MVMLRLARLKPGEPIEPDVPGERVTINFHDLPAAVQTLQGAIDYVVEHPEVLPVKITRALELYRGHPLARKPH